MTDTESREETTPMLTLNAWGREMRFGNLLKQGGVNSLCWYTVELGVTAREIFVFDAQCLAGRDFHFASDIAASVRQAQALIEGRFKSFEAFAEWVRTNFYSLPN